VIEEFHRLGIGIALDDFGTGFSSLSYLVLLNPRIIKIDRYFVNPPNESVQNEMLLESIVSLGNKLHMTMLAEGIETNAQLERLRHFNCELGQGYLFSPAVPASEVATMLARIPGNWGQGVGTAALC
jgi:EAL domain-containing protein (putative c-di-GMP-specific phosphodiesterase class I)